MTLYELRNLTCRTWNLQFVSNVTDSFCFVKEDFMDASSDSEDDVSNSLLAGVEVAVS
jgi:hypothetical protein